MLGNPRDTVKRFTASARCWVARARASTWPPLNGQDRVQQCEVFYCFVNATGLVLNNVNSQAAGSAW